MEIAREKHEKARLKYVAARDSVLKYQTSLQNTHTRLTTKQKDLNVCFLDLIKELRAFSDSWEAYEKALSMGGN